MPYIASTGVNHDGVYYDIGSVIADDLGAAILAEHPSSLTRIAHDDDICATDCAHRAPDPGPAKVSIKPLPEVTN